MKTNFFCVRHGDGTIEQSMGRLLAFMAGCTGIVIAAFGIVFKDAGIIAIGAGLFGTGELLKFGQKVAEK
jgi:hypothetical protein